MTTHGIDVKYFVYFVVNKASKKTVTSLGKTSIDTNRLTHDIFTAVANYFGSVLDLSIGRRGRSLRVAVT